MKNKCTLIFLFTILFGVYSFGQPDVTATLATVEGTPGAPVTVSLTVTNFINVSAITIKISFTSGVLTFINLTNQFPGFTPTVGYTGNSVSIVWSSLTPISITSGTLADLNFQYHGTSTALTFYGCQVSSYGPPPGDLVVTYTDGAVYPDQELPNHAQIGTRLGFTGSPVSVPLYYPVFTVNAGAVTQFVKYDTSKLTFSGITPLGHFAGALGNATGGVIGITWSDPTGVDISTPGDTIHMNFTVTGTPPVPLTFNPGCVISTASGGNIPVTYFNGLVANLQDSLNLTNVTVGSGQTRCYNALQVITVAGNGTTFTVQSGGSATMIAGQKISYLPGTTVLSGGYMHGYIAPGGPFCTAPSIPSKPMAEEELPMSIEQSSFKIYPNPTTGNFILELKGEIPTNEVRVDVYGMRGERVNTGALNGERRHEFTLSDRPAGIYFIRVISGSNSETARIIKQ